MSFDREAISNALYALLTASGTFLAGGRRWKPYAQTSDFPALYLVDGDEKYRPRQARGESRVVDLEYESWIYSKTVQPDRAPASDLNPLIQAVVGLFDPSFVMPVQTLGVARVDDSWVDDQMKIIKDVAPISGHGRAMIPVKVRVV